MSVENIPWMIQGGKHSAGSGRRVLFHATGGAEGISSIGDLRVLQQSIATGSVKVSPGSCVMVSRYPGVRNESYDGANLSDTTVPIAPNGGGSTRYDLVIARVDDWNFAGQQPVPTTLPTDTVPAFKLTVISGVASTTKTAGQLNLGYPAIALARIAVPAATSAITQAMITDLREKAVPRRQRSLSTHALVGADTDPLNYYAGSQERWPDVPFTVEVPEWATQVRVRADWAGVKEPPGNAYGSVWVALGYGDPAKISTQSTGWDTPGGTGNTRGAYIVADKLAVPAALRGKSIVCELIGKIAGGSSGAYPILDAYSAIVLDLEWLEAPTEDV